MDKIYSKVLLGILSVLFIANVVACIKTQSNSTLVLKIAFIVSLSVLSISIIALVVHNALLCHGFSVKHESKDISALTEKVSIFLPIDAKELGEMDTQYNITDIISSYAYKNGRCTILDVIQTRGLVPCLYSQLKLDTSKPVEMLYGSKYFGLENKSGICIVTSADISYVKTQLSGMTLPKIVDPTIKENRMISLSCQGIKIFNHKTKIPIPSSDIVFFRRNFEKILRSEVDTTDKNAGPSVVTLYDLVSDQILNLQCVNKFRDGTWRDSETCKLAYTFFSIFDPRHFRSSKILRRSPLENYMIDYVKKKGEYTDPYYVRKVYNLIASIYLMKSQETSLYSRLHRNRYVNCSGKRISDVLRAKMSSRKFALICAVAVYNDGYEVNTKSNDFIKELLRLENKEDALRGVEPLFYGNKFKRCVKRVMQYDDADLNDVLEELLPGYHGHSCKQLISVARQYIMNSCKEHALLYFEEYKTIDVGDIKDIIITSNQLGKCNIRVDPVAQETDSIIRMA